MNQRGWLIYSREDAETNKSYIDWFIDEARLQGISLELVLREELTVGIIQNKQTIFHKNLIVQLPDFAVIRTIEPLLNKLLESMGISVYNSSSISSFCNNKALTHFHINKLSIPMVDTIFVKRKNLLLTPPMDFPFVVKENDGRGGNQVYLINNQQEWKKYFADVSAQELIIQSTKNVQLGKDVRVFVVGNKIIGAVLRESKSDFRSNYKLGGSATWYSLNHCEKKLINRIIQEFDFGMVGVDFLIDNNGGMLFNEIEDVVGSRTLSAVSDKNILAEYVAYIKRSGNM
ncbi:ATP-grasp domain-containing protein [Virgibacillus doumboii]|uniref:ATP-grasp domain-containing protein n=1 Tax=Virgibacillus doumboii TaxID=2697503 RepID=UPI0013E0AF5C|nr:ATP-grasp domain-containing protein [Virgibacillus doumboii]